NIVFLTECFRRFRNCMCSLVADGLDAFEAEKFSFLVRGFYHSIGNKSQPVPSREWTARFRIAAVLHNSQRQPAFNGQFFAIPVWRQMSRVGNCHYAIGCNQRSATGDESRDLPMKHIVQM